jgi:putative hydrolase of the HAD superfamily
MWAMAAKALDPEEPDPLCRVLQRIEARSWERVSEDQVSTTLEQILREATRVTGLNVRAEAYDEAHAAHLDAWTPHIVHHPDAKPVLAELKQAGYKIGLLSNTHWPRAFHQRFLERDGLADYIDAAVYTSELPRTKPHPSAFKAVLKLLDVPDARHAVFVGDRLYDDIFGARQMGMRAALKRSPATDDYPERCLIRRGEIFPDAKIDTLTELVPWVLAWS